MRYRRRSVLIANGNRPIAQQCREHLEQAGFGVFVASDGEQACILAARQRFDLMITNLELPLVSGAEFCRHVREDLQLHDVPIAVCAPAGRQGHAAELAADYGIAKIFSLPIDNDSVVEFARETSGNLVTA
jgi:DNA-binding response OmpR family regulator